MSALESVMKRILRDEVKSHHHSRSDLEELLSGAMAKHTSGIVRKEDLDENVKRMEKSLSKVRSGASAAEIQQATEQGVENLMQRYSRKQSKLEAAPPPQPMPYESQPRSRLRTGYTIEEIPEETVPVQKGNKTSSTKSRSLPPPPASYEHQQPTEALLTSDALARMGGNPGEAPSKSHASKSRAPVMQSGENALARVKRPKEASQVPTAFASDALARLPTLETSSSKSKSSKGRASNQPGDDVALARVKRSIAPSEAPPALTSDVLARRPDPDANSSKSKSSKTHTSIEPRDDNALARLKRASAPSGAPAALTENALARLPAAEVSPSTSRSSKTRASVQPSDGNALVRPRRSATPPTVQVADFADAAVTESALACVKHSEGKSHTASSKKSTASVQPSSSNALAPPDSNSGESAYRSSAEAMSAAQGGQLSPFGGAGHDAYGELPDDFPDTASQVTSWQRSKESKGKSSKVSSVMADNIAVSRIQPKNDRRAEATAPRTSSGLRQVTYPKASAEESNTLVRQSTDVSRRSSKK